MNVGALEKYQDSKKVFKIAIEMTRGIEKEKIDVGQSVAIFPHNLEDDVSKVIKAFAWTEDELLGNKTIR